jgi:hypothetical protein
MGQQQVGKAAIEGWRLLRTELETSTSSCAIWPFNGPFDELIRSFCTVVVETYPADFYERVGVLFATRGGKRQHISRRAQSERLLETADRCDLETTAALRSSIADGFGARPDGEDPFDAFVGLLGILDAIRAGDTGVPSGDPAIPTLEGWMFGHPG